jgi:septum formation protein
MSTALVLASSSIYRKKLMEKLNLPFVSASPNIYEARWPSESPDSLVRRLSEEKARALSKTYCKHLIIGSDQVAILTTTPFDPMNFFETNANAIDSASETLCKPENHEQALEQLKLQSGKRVTFLTSVSVLNTAIDEIETDVITTDVVFRRLDEKEINNYLYRDLPYDCTGSFKVENSGITLLDAIYSCDPTALIGLPLIRLRKMLEKYKLNKIN